MITNVYVDLNALSPYSRRDWHEIKEVLVLAKYSLRGHGLREALWCAIDTALDQIDGILSYDGDLAEVEGIESEHHEAKELILDVIDVQIAKKP